MAKTFLEMLATLPQTPKHFPWGLRGSRKRQKVFRGTCGTPANTKKFLERLAGLPQTPKSFSRDLRGSRKRQKVFRGTCNSVANAKKFFVGLATVLQTPESFSWDLQHCCKRQKVFRRTCNGVASISKSTMTAAARYQRPSLWIRPPIPSSNSRYGKEDHAWGVGSPQVGKKPEGWCGIDAVALAAAEAVIANFRPWIIYYHHAAIPRRFWANFWQHIC